MSLRGGSTVAKFFCQLLQQLRLSLSQSLAGLFDRPLVPDVDPYDGIARLVLLVDARACFPVFPLDEAATDFAHCCHDALGNTEFFVFLTRGVELFIQADNLAVTEIARVLESNPSPAADDIIVINFCDSFDRSSHC